jgi:hypothetical protein
MPRSSAEPDWRRPSRLSVTTAEAPVAGWPFGSSTVPVMADVISCAETSLLITTNGIAVASVKSTAVQAIPALLIKPFIDVSPVDCRPRDRLEFAPFA